MLTDVLFVLDQFVLQGLLGICGSGRCVADAGFNGSSRLPFSSTAGPPLTMDVCCSRADTTSLCRHRGSKGRLRPCLLCVIKGGTGISVTTERNVCRHGRSGSSKISSPSFLSSSTLMIRIDFTMALRR